VFAKQTFTLDRLDKICGIVGIAITDLAKMVEYEAERVTQLTLEQEREIVADPKLMLVAVHALNHWTLEEIVAHYTISKTDCIRLLARLDRLRIIDLLPNNRIRVIVGRNFSWRPDGPFQRHFRDQLEANFFGSRFDGRGEHLAFVSGMLSRNSNAVVSSTCGAETEFTELHNQDAACRSTSGSAQARLSRCGLGPRCSGRCREDQRKVFWFTEELPTRSAPAQEFSSTRLPRAPGAATLEPFHECPRPLRNALAVSSAGIASSSSNAR
jgi:hypothetical protein